MLTQPVFMGGSLIALNKMADIHEDLQQHSADARRQATIYETDKAYWQVVSLRHKQKLAQAYLDVVKKLDKDVHRMIEEGVATKSDGLSVDVKVNEAEMTLTRVNDGLVLSKMLQDHRVAHQRTDYAGRRRFGQSRRGDAGPEAQRGGGCGESPRAEDA